MPNKNPSPVQLHPEMDKSQTTAFINDNFRRLYDKLDHVTSGTATISPRNENVVLTTTNIGYIFEVTLESGLSAVKALAGDLRVRVVFDDKMDVMGSGTFVDDGTNKAIYSYNYRLTNSVITGTGDIHVTFAIRLIAGTVTFNPYTFLRNKIHWDIYNQLKVSATGGGALATGVGKYCFVDTQTCYLNGTVSDVVSRTYEFNNRLLHVGGPYIWTMFPYPMFDLATWFGVP